MPQDPSPRDATLIKVRMAKAERADMDMAFELANLLEALSEGLYPYVDGAEDDPVWFESTNHEHLVFLHLRLLAIASKGSLFRVAGGMDTLLDPDNAIVDPDDDCIALHPRFAEMQAVPKGHVPAPMILSPLQVAEIKDMLHQDYAFHLDQARPLWARLLEIVCGVRMAEQEAMFVAERGVAPAPLSPVQPKQLALAGDLLPKVEAKRWYSLRGIDYRVNQVIESSDVAYLQQRGRDYDQRIGLRELQALIAAETSFDTPPSECSGASGLALTGDNRGQSKAGVDLQETGAPHVAALVAAGRDAAAVTAFLDHPGLDVAQLPPGMHDALLALRAIVDELSLLPTGPLTAAPGA